MRARNSRIIGLQEGQRRKHRPDYALVVITAILLVIGLIVVFSIGPGLSALNGTSESFYYSKQLLAILAGVVAFTTASYIPLVIWKKATSFFVVGAIIATIMVLVFGQEVNGATRWVQVGGLSFQAVELIKFAILVWMATFLAARSREGNLDDQKMTLQPILMILLVVGFVIAILQSDLGSMVVVVAMMAAMSFVAGVRMKKIVLMGGLIAVGLALAISISPYRRERFLTFVQPERDCQSSGYQACQALIAIGSGGIFGKGVANSVQAYGYLPEAANDSIFAIYAEKFGFLGVVALLGLFVALFTRLKNIMERAPDLASRLFIAGILAWLSTQTIINIGAMAGLLPLKGITLPLVSYGGTSIIFVMLAVGLAFNISRYTTFTTNEFSGEGGSDENTRIGRRNRRTHNTYRSHSSRA